MWNFIVQGHWVMIPLLITSIIGLTFIIERGLALRWAKVIPPRLEDALAEIHSPEDIPRVKQFASSQPSVLGRLLQVACDNSRWSRAENAQAIEIRARHEVVNLERGLVVLEIIVGIAPLMGLVGSIHGLMRLFGGMGATGFSENTQFASGVAEALNTTLAGLLIAIPSLTAWSYYNKKVERFAVELERLCDEFLRRLYRSK